MKLCPCGSEYHRHGKSNTQAGGDRYKCKGCGKTITVRNGQIVKPNHHIGRPAIPDWRMGA